MLAELMELAIYVVIVLLQRSLIEELDKTGDRTVDRAGGRTVDRADSRTVDRTAGVVDRTEMLI